MWYVARAIWYHLYNLKEVKNTHGGVLRKPEKAKACNFTKSNILPLVFFTFFKLYKWDQIAQYITYFSFSKINLLLMVPSKVEAPELKQKGPYISSPSMDAETTRLTTPPPPKKPTSMLSIKEGYWGIPQ